MSPELSSLVVTSTEDVRGLMDILIGLINGLEKLNWKCPLM